MNSEYLYTTGNRLVKRFGTRDPFAIADDLGIDVIYSDHFGSLKGMYRVVKGCRFIFINRNLPEKMQRIVCAHELGHDQLHRHLAKGGAIREFMLYDMTLRPEYEANVVAADILLDTEEMLEHIYEDRYSMEQITKAMGTDPNLVALKIECLVYAGYKLPKMSHRSDFLA